MTRVVMIIEINVKKICGPRTPYHILRTLNSVTATET